MKNFFFTFGTISTHPFVGGWIKVVARSREEAENFFADKFGRTKIGALRCSLVYSEEEFARTGMEQYGNFGRFQHGETLYAPGCESGV